MIIIKLLQFRVCPRLETKFGTCKVPLTNFRISLLSFFQNENLSLVTQQIGYHPEYLKEFLKTQHFLMQGDGPLRYDYRHYIAIMVSNIPMCVLFCSIISIYTSQTSRLYDEFVYSDNICEFLVIIENTYRRFHYHMYKLLGG